MVVGSLSDGNGVVVRGKGVKMSSKWPKYDLFGPFLVSNDTFHAIKVTFEELFGSDVVEGFFVFADKAFFY